MKRIVSVLTMLLAVVCFADGAGMAPVNPLFRKWQNRRKNAITNQVPSQLKQMKLATSSADETVDVPSPNGAIPTERDFSYLTTCNQSGSIDLSISRAETLPRKYDLREQGLVTSVKDQAHTGTCWAHASCAALESWILKSSGKSVDLSENNLVNLAGWDLGYNEGGNATMASGYFTRWNGPVLEADDPFGTTGYGRKGLSTKMTPAYHVQQMRIIVPRSSSDNTAGTSVKRALMTYGALYVNYWSCAYQYKSNYNYYLSYSSFTNCYYNHGDSCSGHAVTLVGWDDDYPKENFKTTPPGNGAYLIKNSWGTSIGDGGYMYISYYDCLIVRSGMEPYAFPSAESNENYSKLYEYDPYGMSGSVTIGFSSATAYGANVFTATGNDSIAAVGFYSPAPQTSVKIKIYTALSSATAPCSGTLALTQSGTADSAGYFTIPLSTPVSVASGCRFSVVLEVNAPGSYDSSSSRYYPLAFETIGSNNSKVTASAGQSFFSSNGTKWSDVYSAFNTTQYKANFCVKAYVANKTVSKSLTSISCYSSDNSTKVASGKTKPFTCKATYSDGSEKEVTPTWSITSGSSYGSISSSGLFTAASVTSEQDVGVKASYAEGGITKTSSFTVTITVAAPSAPTGLTVTSGTESSCVRLSWSAVSGATGYTVYRAKGSGKKSSSASYLGTVDQPKYADTDATPGVDYTYFIKAKNGSGTSGFSTGASGWRALAAPSDVAASDGTSVDCVKIGWGEVLGASYYRVYRGTDEDNLTALSGWISDLSYSDTTATPGTLYYYAVKAALNTEGTRASELSIADTGIREKASVPEKMTISGPSSLASGAQGSYTASVRWSNGNTITVTPTWTCEGKTSTVATFTYTAPVVSASKTVTLTAKATVESVALTASYTITVSPSISVAPSAPTITSKTTSGISLSWSAVLGASSYVVYRGTSTTSSSATKIGTVTGTTFTDTSVTPGQTVYYFLAAVNTAGTSALSPASSAAVRTLAAPTGVAASNGTYTDKVRVTWSAVAGASYYRVSRSTSLSGSQTDLGSWQTGTTYDDTSATAGTTYYYFVRAATSSSGANVSAKSSPGAKGLRKVAVTLSSLAISGPDRVDAGSTAVYAAKATYSDGTSKTVSSSWSISSGSGATIDATGKLTASSVTSDAIVTIQAVFGGLTQTKSVTIVAPIPKTVTVSNVKATSRWPWKPLIDIDYTLAVSPSDTKADISVEVTDKDRQQTFLAQTLTGDTEDLAAGTHRVTWNVGSDKPDFTTSALDIDVKARVHEAEGPQSTYLVIDLSGGTTATSYPVTELASVPSGGWTDEYKTTKLVLRRIEAGSFTMGSPSGEVGRSSNEDQHTVTLTKSFYIGVFEVTQRQWELVMGTKPSYFSNASYYTTRPVEQVSYDMIRGWSAGEEWPSSSAVDATSFLGKIRAKTGLEGFDLPTEAQWEYACRAGTTTALNSGKNLTSTSLQDANMAEVGRYWYNGGSSYSSSGDTTVGTAKVGSYAPNAWGLYDMHGNVCEWCLDWYVSSLGTSAVTDPVGATSGFYRLLRGGDWLSYLAHYCRSAHRHNDDPFGGDDASGFRLSLR